jgi:hypothetical protein
MDHVTQHKGIVDVFTAAFKLLRQVCFSNARESFNDLGRWDQNMGLYDDHTSFTDQFLGISLVLVLVDSQPEVVPLAVGTDDADDVILFDPQELGPLTKSVEFKKNWTFYEPCHDRYAVLIHWRTQLEV